MTEIRLRPTASLDGLDQALRKQASDAENVESNFVGGHPKDYLAAYLAWANEASRILGNDLQRTQLEQLLHTRHYWALRQMDGSEAWLTGQVKAELKAQREALLELAKEARKLARRWNVLGVIVVPDTNVLLHVTAYFDEVDWPTALAIDESVHLVIPMIVVDQLDKLKRSTQPIRSKARQTAGRLEALLGKQDRVLLGRTETPGPIAFPGQPETTLQVLVDPLDHTRLADSDSEIVDRAIYMRDLTHLPVYIATWDNLMRFRARGAGIETVKPLPEYELQDEPPRSARQARPRRGDQESPCNGGTGDAGAV
jgi:hypothetical protein